jgi:hypothetical protein
MSQLGVGWCRWLWRRCLLEEVVVLLLLLLLLLYAVRDRRRDFFAQLVLQLQLLTRMNPPQQKAHHDQQ